MGISNHSRDVTSFESETYPIGFSANREWRDSARGARRGGAAAPILVNDEFGPVRVPLIIGVAELLL